jgi:hypothetical protein
MRHTVAQPGHIIVWFSNMCPEIMRIYPFTVVESDLSAGW